MGDVLWFPANQLQALEIPAYVHFTTHRFSSDIAIRQQPIQNFWYGSSLGEAFLPVPVEIGTSIKMQYTTDPSTIISSRSLRSEKWLESNTIVPGTLYDATHLHRHSSWLRGVGYEGTDESIRAKVDNAPPSVRSSHARAYENYLDIVDTTWMGQVRRKYVFNFVLLAKSTGDAAAAINLCNFFSNRLLSRLKPQNMYSAGNNSMSSHPPMWAINIVNNNIESAQQATLNWLGMYPQLCVLEEVSAFRTGGDGTTILALQELDGHPLPIQCVIQLSFSELEPVYVPWEHTGALPMAKGRSQFFTET